MEQKRPFWVEFILPAAVGILAVIYYFQTEDLSRQAVFFPHSMMVAMAVLSAIVLIKEFLDRHVGAASRKEAAPEAEAAPAWRATLLSAKNAMLVFALALANYILIIFFGYFTATVLFLLASLVIFRVGIIRSAILSVAFTGALYVVFVVAFQIRVAS